MDFEDIRRLVLIAIASDEELAERLVLKGGNALSLVYNIGNRASRDIDFSIEGDIDSIDELGATLSRVISARFLAAGYVVFDTKIGFNPKVGVGKFVPAWWGGYLFQFKVISKDLHQKHAHDIEMLRRLSHPVADGQLRKFDVEISRGEYCGDTRLMPVGGDFALRVYSLQMMICEKLRAICQQLA